MPDLHPKFIEAIKAAQDANPEYVIGGSERHGLVCHEYRMTAESETDIVAGAWGDSTDAAGTFLSDAINEPKAKP